MASFQVTELEHELSSKQTLSLRVAQLIALKTMDPHSKYIFFKVIVNAIKKCTENFCKQMPLQAKKQLSHSGSFQVAY